uniref:Uncharacterized protein n=1 Tax=Anguilla anguilla TaxID=7936 RepID=A0A0E9RGY7_ANGAN
MTIMHKRIKFILRAGQDC